MKFLLAISPTIALVVYGQLVSKWRVGIIAKTFDPTTTPLGKFLSYLQDPYVVSAYIGVFASSLTWMLVIERYPLSQAFPVHIGLTFMLVVLGSWMFLGEVVTPTRGLAIFLILLGVIIGSRS